MDASFRNLLIGLALYAVVAAAVLWWVWRRTAQTSSATPRAWLRALAVSCLFSPTVFACGGIAPVPFPILVALDVYALLTSAANQCGFQSVPKAILVAAVGVTFGLVHLGVSRWQHAHTKQAI